MHSHKQQRLKRTSTLTNTTIPASCRNPASRLIPAQQMQRTDTQTRACRSGASRHALAKHAHTHSRKQQHQAYKQPNHHLIPASCRNPASQHSRCSAQTRASGLAGAERAKTHSRSTRNTPRNLAASRGPVPEERQHMKGGAPCFCESFWTRSSSCDVVTFVPVIDYIPRRPTS